MSTGHFLLLMIIFIFFVIQSPLEHLEFHFHTFDLITQWCIRVLKALVVLLSQFLLFDILCSILFRISTIKRVTISEIKKLCNRHLVLVSFSFIKEFVMVDFVETDTSYTNQYSVVRIQGMGQEVGSFCDARMEKKS